MSTKEARGKHRYCLSRPPADVFQTRSPGSIMTFHAANNGASIFSLQGNDKRPLTNNCFISLFFFTVNAQNHTSSFLAVNHFAFKRTAALHMSGCL